MKKSLFAILIALMLVFTFAFVACDNSNDNKEQKIELEDGSTYVGEVVDGVPNGQGTLTDMVGSEWTGTFVNGKLNGYGKYVGYDFTEYEGMFKDGLFDGVGHMVDVNGNDFKGTFTAGKADGVIRIEWTTGCYYEGGAKNGLMDGMGWMTWPVGDAYFGEWVNGNPNGFGCKVYYDSSIASCVKGDYTTYNKYVGEITNNMPDGYGIMYFQGSGGIYIGNWDDGTRDDQNGIYYFEPGIEFVKFEGAFSKSMNGGWIWGEGTMWYSDGRVVTGTWESTTCVQEKSTGTAETSLIINEAEAAAQSVLNNESINTLMGIVG